MNFDYLLLNSEFTMDSDLTGFKINAMQYNDVYLSVILFYFISLLLWIKLF